MGKGMPSLSKNVLSKINVLALTKPMAYIHIL